MRDAIKSRAIVVAVNDGFTADHICDRLDIEPWEFYELHSQDNGRADDWSDKQRHYFGVLLGKIRNDVLPLPERNPVVYAAALDRLRREGYSDDSIREGWRVSEQDFARYAVAERSWQPWDTRTKVFYRSLLVRVRENFSPAWAVGSNTQQKSEIDALMRRTAGSMA